MLQAFKADVQEDISSQQPSGLITSEVKGLDKLVEQGFNHDEIRALRFHFHAMCILKYDDYNAKSETLRISFEERWLNGQIADFNLSPEESCQYDMQMVRNRVDTSQRHGDGLRLGLCVWCSWERACTICLATACSKCEAEERSVGGTYLQSISLRAYPSLAELGKVALVAFEVLAI
jgi:hypothetical protein